MAEKLGEALLDLDTNDKGLKAGIGRAERLSQGLARTFDGLSKRAVRLGRDLALSSAVGAAALSVLVKRAIDTADNMSKAAQRAGVTTEELSRLAWAGELADVSLDSLAASLGRLANVMGQIARGDAKDTKAILDGLGISVTDADGKLRSASAVMGDLADRFAAMPNGAEKSALAIQVFGRSGAELIPMLNEGSAGLARLADESDRLGKTISTTAGRDAEEFNDTLTRIGAIIDGVTLKVMSGALPALQELASNFADPDFAAAATGFGQIVIAVLNAIVQGASNAANNIRMLKDVFSDVSNMSTEGLDGRLRELGRKKLDLDNQIVTMQSKLDRGDDLFGINRGALTSGIDQARTQITALIDQEQQILDLLAQRKAITETMSDAGSSSVDLPALPDLTGIFDGLGDSAAAADDPVQQLLGSLRAERDTLREMDPVLQRMILLRDQLTKATPAQRQEIEALVRTIHEESTAWESAQAAGQFFGDQLLDSIEGLRTGSKSLVDVLDDVINALAQAVLQSMLLGQGPLSGMFGTQGAGGGIGGILGGLFSGMFAKGGLIPNGTFGIVGENGPEPVIGTSRGAQVLPNSSLAKMMGGGGRGDVHIAINGSGLTQSELSQAIADALDRYDRFTLPGRVAAIQADPRARG